MEPVHLRVESHQAFSTQTFSVQTSSASTIWCPVQPELENTETARFIAAMLSRAWREQKIPQAPVVTLPDAQILMEALHDELDIEIDMIVDEAPGRNGDTDGWGLVFGGLETLRSIDPQSDGSVALDYDQAFCVSDTIISALEAAETLEGEETRVQELRRHGRQLQAAGFPIAQTYGNGYKIQLSHDLDDETENQTAYWVLDPRGKLIGTAMSLDDGWKKIQEHRGPLVDAQAQPPLEEDS